MRQILAILLTGWVSSEFLLAGEPASPACPMQPVARTITLPRSGFSWLPGGESRGRCEDVPSDGWSPGRPGTGDLSVHVDGPEGSGRFWNIIVGVPKQQQSRPDRGICITTSTLGWRTLQRYSKGGLPWLDDVNNDGRAELILWDSFPLHDDAFMAEYGLVAWVYRQDSARSLVVDLELSRELARSLAKEYRSPLKGTSGYPGDLRVQAAEALEQLADKRCRVTPGGAR